MNEKPHTNNNAFRNAIIVAVIVAFGIIGVGTFYGVGSEALSDIAVKWALISFGITLLVSSVKKVN